MLNFLSLGLLKISETLKARISGRETDTNKRGKGFWLGF